MRHGQHTSWADAQEAALDARLYAQDRSNHFCEQMISDWLDGYVICGRRGVDAQDEFGSLNKAADAMVQGYMDELDREAAECWIN